MLTVTFQLVITVCHAQTTLHILKLTYNEIKYKMLLRNVLFLGDLSLTSRHLAISPGNPGLDSIPKYVSLLL